MCKFWVGLLLVVSFSSVQATEWVPYLSAKAGAVQPRDGYAESSDGEDTVEMYYDMGEAYEFAVGFDIQHPDLEKGTLGMRVELEYSYYLSDMNETDADTDPALEVGLSNVFVNGYLDVKQGRFSPYFMVGFGGTQLEVASTSSGATVNDYNISFQVGFGLNYRLAEHLIIDLDYKFVMPGVMGLDSFINDDEDASFEWDGSAITAGIRIPF
jgi:opacity protein-like surface antigen